MLWNIVHLGPLTCLPLSTRLVEVWQHISVTKSPKTPSIMTKKIWTCQISFIFVLLYTCEKNVQQHTIEWEQGTVNTTCQSRKVLEFSDLTLNCLNKKIFEGSRNKRKLPCLIYLTVLEVNEFELSLYTDMNIFSRGL